MNKIEKLDILDSWGLNTPSRIVIMNEENAEDAEIKMNQFITDHKGASIRTFGIDAWNEPHFPNLNQKDAMPKCVELLKKGYNLIISEPMDPKNNLCACCVMFNNQGDVIAEALFGPEKTVRMLRKGVKSEFMYQGQSNGIRNPYVREIVDTILKSEAIHYGKLFECSKYAVKHGRKNSDIIFWEFEEVKF